jgi:hypothetical protein
MLEIPLANDRFEVKRNISLMNRVIETSEPFTYSNVEGQLEWEYAM